jgi:hypothetical protein
LVHAEPKLFFQRTNFSALLADPEIIGLHISPNVHSSQNRSWQLACPERRNGRRLAASG